MRDVQKWNLCDGWTSTLASTSRRVQWRSATVQNLCGQWSDTGSDLSGCSEQVYSSGSNRGSSTECQCCHLVWDFSTSWCATQTLRYRHIITHKWQNVVKQVGLNSINSELTVLVCHCSAGLGPALTELAPSANSSSVLVSWSWTGTEHLVKPGGEPLHYVIEWTSIPEAELQWKKLSLCQNSTAITGTEHLPHTQMGLNWQTRVTPGGQFVYYTNSTVIVSIKN